MGGDERATMQVNHTMKSSLKAGSPSQELAMDIGATFYKWMSVACPAPGEGHPWLRCPAKLTMLYD